jgi:hypothetical protein
VQISPPQASWTQLLQAGSSLMQSLRQLSSPLQSLVHSSQGILEKTGWPGKAASNSQLQQLE